MSKHDSDFNDQVAIVTGGSSGLGLSISKALLESGAQVVVLDLKNHPDLEKHSAAHFIIADVTNEEKLKEAVNSIWNQFGRIDILVNSAGITDKTNFKSHETSTEDLRRVFEINFMGSYFTSKQVLPYMLKKNYGRILHIASIAGKEGNAGMLAYSSSKAAVIGMTKVQGKEYAESGITINALAPAVVQTPLVDGMLPEQVKYMTDKIPMKRCGTLEEIAGIVLYIVSPKNSFTTGFTFDLSGGRATY